MLYAHYSIGTVVSIAFSGDAHSISNINWRKDRPKFDASIALIKTIAPQKRSFDSDAKIWFLLPDDWTVIKALFDGSLGITCVDFGTKPYAYNYYGSKVDFNSFIDFVKGVRSTVKAQAQRPEDFFYTRPQTQKTKTLAEIESELQDLAGLDILSSDLSVAKKAYRKAAMLYHPDRNNGDSSKMSELNVLWSEYNKLSLKVGA